MQFFQRSISNKRNAGPEGKDDVLSMIAGERIPVNTGSFTNDMTTFRTEDDVLTLLIHLGYLAYDSENKVVKIPNNEVRNEYVNSVAASDWGEVSIALKQSADTLNAIWQRRPQQVAEGIQLAHFETSHIQYNDNKKTKLHECMIEEYKF